MNVLSLFDGISCGQVALQRAGIEVDNYFASEIDKHAIAITQARHPKTIQLGSVTEVFAKDLPKIDLLVGGSPCTGFSTAGKGLNFEDPQSKLFFEWLRLRDECKPTYFLLENVRMKKQWEKVITDFVGCEPVFINSARFSAQDRKRLYWTNIPIGELPIDSGIYLKDILEPSVDEKYYLDKYLPRLKFKDPNYLSLIHQSSTKSKVIARTSSYGTWGRIVESEAKSTTLLAKAHMSTPMILEQKVIGTIAENGNYCQGNIVYDDDVKSAPLDSSHKGRENLILEKSNRVGSFGNSQCDKVYDVNSKGGCLLSSNGIRAGVILEEAYHKSVPIGEIGNGQGDRVFDTNGKGSSLMANGGNTGGRGSNVIIDNYRLRRLTPLECERLQTLPDEYTGVPGIAMSHRYRALGNGWTVNVIAHIFKGLPNGHSGQA